MRPDPIPQVLRQGFPPHSALCVAFSGGRDSTVLLHALAGLSAPCGLGVRAVHVNHGLQATSREWEKHCADVAGRLGVPYSVLRVTVQNDRGLGLEASARESRYAALRAQLQAGEWLLTAHHADDQLETVLLHLFRGSGVSGLAGIPRQASFGPGHLCRPLLDVPGEAFADYASNILQPEGLGWLVDPMNADRAYDRGFLRHEVTPILLQRFPAAARAAGRSAALAAEAAGVLDELAQADSQAIVLGHRLAEVPFRQLSAARQRNLIRYQARERGWAVPPERRLREGLAQLLGAATGRQPVLRWSGHEIRRFREHLYLLDTGIPGCEPDDTLLDWPDPEPLVLGGSRGELRLHRGARAGQADAMAARLAPALVAGGLRVGFRRGGERVRAQADRHHRTLKYLFQLHGIVPWMRGHLPLVFARAELAAVADLWTADWAAAAPDESGFQIVWSGHAPIQ